MASYKQRKGTDTSGIVLENIEEQQNIFDAYKSTIVAMAAAINAKDPHPYTTAHIERLINAYRSTVRAMGATIDAIDSYPHTSTYHA